MCTSIQLEGMKPIGSCGSSIQYFRRRWMSVDDAADDVRPLTSSHLEGVGCPRVVVQVIYSDSAPSESKKISESEWVE